MRAQRSRRSTRGELTGKHSSQLPPLLPTTGRTCTTGPPHAGSEDRPRGSREVELTVATIVPMTALPDLVPAIARTPPPTVTAGRHGHVPSPAIRGSSDKSGTSVAPSPRAQAPTSPLPQARTSRRLATANPRSTGTSCGTDQEPSYSAALEPRPPSGRAPTSKILRCRRAVRGSGTSASPCGHRSAAHDVASEPASSRAAR
jgi:hypothetical protein